MYVGAMPAVEAVGVGQCSLEKAPKATAGADRYLQDKVSAVTTGAECCVLEGALAPTDRCLLAKASTPVAAVDRWSQEKAPVEVMDAECCAFVGAGTAGVE